MAYAFQTRIELECADGFYPRSDLSTYQSDDFELRLGDLHYRDVREYAVGRNTSAGWQERRDATNDPLPVTRVWTDFLPQQEVERVVPARSDGVEFGMEALARAAVSGAEAVSAALDSLPELYAEWRRGQEGMMTGLAPRRLKTGHALLENVDTAGSRIRDGIDLLKRDTVAREAFGLMNTAMAMANRRREAVIQQKLPGDVDPPTWRPFQLAFVLLNLVGVTDRNSGEREIVDLLFFPTGGGKSVSWTCRLCDCAEAAPRIWRAGCGHQRHHALHVTPAHAAGLVCALEFLRTHDDNGRKTLGEWPMEIGLWVGGAASPNNPAAKFFRQGRRDDLAEAVPEQT
ncbi:MAG: hypothetical protein E5V62_02845 [Mesorhizobium sp.]|uniref:hypothetical protein n=1 Tax=Mesorhizobium sp. TaxID=1871066 RepID=UPI000FE71794|nr:hypothetical protein [Mesorhizobium sp.]RWD53698.1 MAG: hypothetical protein EOS75_25310 [Mesorhizobium sp.]TIW37218.1 MAG: hypothetical protein E5V62_02845 [Mesorhizobium sp.]